MKHSCLFLASLGMVAPLFAQQIVLPSPPLRERPVFFVPSKAEQDCAIEIAEVSVHTRLVGALAETTVTIVLHNPNSRDMEGDISYPLPPDATVQGYALDINGKMVDGVPVPKQKARVAFESEQRRNVDPGLAEWSGGNRFKTRVSPIPAHGKRTVRLRYTTMVQQNGSAASYRLPLDFDKVGSFKLRIEAQTGQAPQVQPSGLGNLSFAAWQNQFVLEREWKELALKEDLVIDLPQGMAEAAAVEKHGGQYYLTKLVPSPSFDAQGVPAPESLDLVWDASGSMERVDKAPILEYLRLYFASRADIPCRVRLVVVRDTVEPAREFLVEQGNATELLEALKQISYDGATADLASAMQEDVLLRLLVTDGNVNFAPKGKGSVSHACFTYALVASSGVDMAALRRWAAVPLDLLRQTPQQCLESAPTLRLRRVELDGQPWDAALTNAPDGVVDAAVLLTAPLPEGRHEVALVFYAPFREGEYRVSFSVDTAGAAEGSLNRSFYAQNKLAALLMEPDTPAREMLLRQLGEEYGIVTPGTSLLVLETLSQYLEHQVRPPACCPEFRAHYDARIDELSRRQAETRERALASQKERAAWERENLMAWYETDFSAVLPSVIVGRGGHAGAGDVPATVELASRASRPSRFEAPAVVVMSAGAAPVSMTTVEVGDDELEDDAGVEIGLAEGEEEDGFFSQPSPESAAEPAPAPAPVVPQVNEDAEDEGGEGPEAEEGTAEAPRVEAPATSPAAAIRVQAWSSGAPYLALLKDAADPEAIYLEQRRQYADSPGFYLDCADFFEKDGKRAFAVRVLSNLLEMDMENRSLMRAAAGKLRSMGEVEKAIILFRKVLELFPEEPQSYRDLSLAYADAGRWQEAAETMALVFEKPMDERFYGMEQIAGVELANIIARARREGKPTKTDGMPELFLKPIEADLRVVINWDTDMSDMDLWVTDPRGERCFYGHNRTRTGGRISRDVTGGYGPEEFLIRKALPGGYKVQAHYFGSRSMKMLAPVTLYAEVYTDYGRPNEKRESLVFRLDGRDQLVHIADIAYAGTPSSGSAATRDYQVRAGESWESIAEKELGASSRAAEIIALNPGARADVPPATGTIILLPKN